MYFKRQLIDISNLPQSFKYERVKYMVRISIVVFLGCMFLILVLNFFLILHKLLGTVENRNYQRRSVTTIF